MGTESKSESEVMKMNEMISEAKELRLKDLLSVMYDDRYYISLFCMNINRPSFDPETVIYKADGPEDLYEQLNSMDTNYFNKKVLSFNGTSYMTVQGKIPGIDIVVSSKDCD